MNTLIKIAEQYEKTAKMLLEKAKILRSGIDPNKCKHGEYTNDLFNTRGCKTCGSPKIVICSHKEVIGKRRNGNICKPNSCNYFQ